ncbi:RloB family protein [Singulisphaera acidiphila]|uniref:RloB-like protein n=1 Tax=Singulisphaera acidiphila (strain ATCC BAA-1392 / DSM 18658 / VKM B-2454 / MOB10) TaxID=886293 RepID=L0D610_SINAD|nr:RloB family protein [Singulisphaera acidiphila]AGA24697.1 hypothetical protein Sinac_0246 [Singulisphaera acidiphila DSM 18658]
MQTPRRDRDRRPGRRSPFRQPKPIILIVCEGEKTEPQYFKGFADNHRNSRVEIKVATEHGVPKTLVELAKKYKKEAEKAAQHGKDENLAYDSVWCVFDVDDHPHIPDARQMANDNDIKLAISNPCFELWLILHFRESPGMQHRKKLLSMLRIHIENYDKNTKYTNYATGYPQATARAKKLDIMAAQASDAGRNPTTGVYELTEMIREE